MILMHVLIFFLLMLFNMQKVLIRTIHRLLTRPNYLSYKEHITITTFAILIILVHIQFATKQITMIECNVLIMLLQIILQTSQHILLLLKATETHQNKYTERNMSIQNSLNQIMLGLQLAIILLLLEMESTIMLTGGSTILISLLAIGGLMTMEPYIKESLAIMVLLPIGELLTQDHFHISVL